MLVIQVETNANLHDHLTFARSTTKCRQLWNDFRYFRYVPRRHPDTDLLMKQRMENDDSDLHARATGN